MTEHDGTIACAERINFQLRDVMKHEETLTPRTDHRCIRQLPRPGLNIDVAAHGMGGSQVPQLLKHVHPSDISRMHDEV
jgi:hypothetical protein